ncbi:MAG: hypothetical protein QXL19_05935 [Ignisphaera sp.]
MSESISESKITRHSEKAEELAREIKKTGVIEIDDRKYYVDQVIVFEKKGIVSGWNIDIDGNPKIIRYTLTDREDMTYMTIHLKKPGIVLAVGEHPRDGSRAIIVYRDD